MEEETQARIATGESAREIPAALSAWNRPSPDERLDEALSQTFPASDPFEISA